MNNRELGNKGEDLACEYLIKNGYEILERNKHFSKLCEIDIIAKYKNKIVFYTDEHTIIEEAKPTIKKIQELLEEE